MKRLLVFVLILVLLTACSESEPPYTDNGNLGQIKAIFFYDDNKNGKMDAGEAGVFPFTFNHDFSLACVCLGQQRIRAGTQKIAAAADQSHRGPARSH